MLPVPFSASLFYFNHDPIASCTATAAHAIVAVCHNTVAIDFVLPCSQLGEQSCE